MKSRLTNSKEKRGGWNRGKKLHYNPKANGVYNPRRFILRQVTWDIVKAQLQQHIKASPPGEAKRIADFCGIRPSQIHRFTCPVCEHDQEPNFTVGMALAIYLWNYNQPKPIIIDTVATPWFL